MGTDFARSYALAQSLLDRVGTAFDTAVARAAALCARDGKLDAKRLDEHQWICYELALANADLARRQDARQRRRERLRSRRRASGLRSRPTRSSSVAGKAARHLHRDGSRSQPLHEIAAGRRPSATAPRCRRPRGACEARQRGREQRRRDRRGRARRADGDGARRVPPFRGRRRRADGGEDPSPRPDRAGDRCCSRCARWACSGCRSPKSTAAARRQGTRTRR